MGNNGCSLTAGCIVGRSRVLRVPTPTFPLSSVDKVQHLSLGCVKRLEVVVVIAAVDPISHKSIMKLHVLIMVKNNH